MTFTANLSSQIPISLFALDALQRACNHVQPPKSVATLSIKLVCQSLILRQRGLRSPKRISDCEASFGLTFLNLSLHRMRVDIACNHKRLGFGIYHVFMFTFWSYQSYVPLCCVIYPSFLYERLSSLLGHVWSAVGYIGHTYIQAFVITSWIYVHADITRTL